jgi:hypothetical protein
MREIIHYGKVFARHIKSNDITKGLNFFSNDDEFIQVGSWKYDAGKELDAHIHNEFPRTVMRTCETFIVLSGSLEVGFFDLNRVFLESLVINKGDILIILECGHSVKILEDNTAVLEVKNGPFLGVETDKTKFDFDWSDKNAAAK